MGGGFYLDRRLGTAPWLLIAGVVLGSVAAIRSLVRATKLLEDEADEKP